MQLTYAYVGNDDGKMIYLNIFTECSTSDTLTTIYR